MDFATVSSAASLVLAVVAVAVSAVISVRQSRIMRHNNLVPVLIDMIGELRSRDFREDLRYVHEELWVRYPPGANGLGDLPGDVRDRVSRVTSFFNTAGVLVANGVVDELLLSAYMGGSILRTWVRFAPYVHAERERRDDPNYYLFFENLAFLAQQLPPDRLNKRLKLRNLPAGWSGDPRLFS